MNQNIVNQWLTGVIQSLALSDALQAFHAATDKELASMAAYKALGLDPSDAPKFGWNLSERPGTKIVDNSTQITASPAPEGQGSPGASRPDTAGWFSSPLRAALLTAGCLLAGGGGAAGVLGLLNHPPLTTQHSAEGGLTTPKAQEFDIQFRIEGGELKIDPPVPVP
jgi:hypothetical protein